MANTSPCDIPVLGHVPPIKIEKYDIFRDVISLLARVFIFLIDRATQEVPMKKYLKTRYVPRNMGMPPACKVCMSYIFHAYTIN